MSNAVNGLVNALTTTISTYTSAIGSGFVDIFRYLFLEIDSNGTIVGFNFLGYTAVILLGLGLICLIVVIVIHYTSMAYKISIIPDDLLVELMEEYDVELHKKELNDWREIVFDIKSDYTTDQIREQALINEMKKRM